MTTSFTIDDLQVKRLFIDGQRIQELHLGALVKSDPTYGVGIGTDTPRLRLDISGTNGIRIPVGTTGERPKIGLAGIVDLSGVLRYNTTLNQYEGYGSGGWGSLGGVTSINQQVTIEADDTTGLTFYTGATKTQRMVITGDTGNMILSGDISANDASFNLVDIHTLNLTTPLFTVGDNGLTKNNFTDALKTKLDGIEANGDVTDTTNVTAAGALMDSEVTDLAGIKAVTISTLQVKPTEGPFVNGDKDKLDNIQSNANNYSLPTAALNILGGIKVGTNLSISNGVLSSTNTTYEVGNNGLTQKNFTSTLKTKLDGIPPDANYSINSFGPGRWISSTGVYRHNDRVGINANPTYANLEIGSAVGRTHNTMFHLHHRTYAGSNATYLDNDTGTKYYSLYCSHAIFAGQGYHMPSDERIKENIRDISDSASLRQLRDISCCYYDYKDKITKGNLTTMGFIAQQVIEHLPIAVRLIKNVIPNEMRIIENPQWTPITDVSGTTYKLTIADLEDVSGGTIHRFYYGNDYAVEYNDDVKSMENEPKSFIFEEQWNNVFLYGKEIDDFHALDKAKLFTLNFSATQEIDKIQQQEKTKLATAEAEINTLKTKNQELETIVTNLINQLKANNVIT